MNSSTEIKNLVREKYGTIANQAPSENPSGCCSSTACCGDEVYNIMADDYTKLEGYNPEADLGLGCGLPTEFAHIREGDIVIDLGSGAGNDAFVARKITGDKGKVIGIDFTEAMVKKARGNNEKLGFVNVEFRLGDIESMPVSSNYANVIVSNCVLNLVPNKHLAFSEIFRVLKPGGHFSISDIVLTGELPPELKEAAEMYVGCVSGAVQKKDYLSIIEESGFHNITIQKEKAILIPDAVLLNYLTEAELQVLKESGTSISSITVYAEKQSKDERNCCEPGSGCC
jgi:SAM-dependent methyltransferase